MEENRLVVSALQMECKARDKEANIKKALSLIDEAAEKGARLMVLPELFTSGYYCFRNRDTSLFGEAESIPGPTTDMLGEKAKEYDAFILAPIFENRHGVFYNSSPLIGPSGEIIGKYSKTHIPLSGGALEKYYFRSGSEFPVFKTSIGNIGVVTCYDRLFPESFRILAVKGADIVLVPSTLYPQKKARVGDDWEFIARTRVKENCVFGVFVNRAGYEEGLQYFGSSFIAGPDGRVIERLGFNEGVLTVEINVDDVEIIRRRRFYLRDRRPEIYMELVKPF
jgi:N-carbamoylputrescine amidase